MNKNTKGKIMNIRRILTIGLLVGYLGSCTCSSAASLNGISLQMYPSNWHAVKDIFIDEPQKVSNRSIWPVVPAAIGAAAAAYASWKKCDKAFDIVNSALWNTREASYRARNTVDKHGNITEDPIDPDDLRKVTYKQIQRPIFTYAATLGALVIGWKAVNWLCRYRSLAASERQQMDRVMESWKQIRADFPEELQPAFEALYQLKTQGSADYEANRDRTITFAKDSVRKHFSKPFLTHIVHELNKIEVPDADQL